MTELSWVPAACTLPTEQQPLRVAEWDQLFAGHLTVVTRPEPLRLHLVLARDAGLEAVRDLAERESGCCSFFTFSVSADADGNVHLVAEVGPAHEKVLTALQDRILAEEADCGN